MKVNTRWALRAVITGLLVSAGALRPGMAHAEIVSVSQKEGFELARWRSEALRGDRTHIPQMIAKLREQPNPLYIYTALHALARLGATEALPDIEALLTTYRPSDDMSAYIRASIARLQTEAGRDADTAALATFDALTPARRASVQARSRAKVEQFLALAGIAPQEIGTAMSAYTQRKTQVLQKGRREEVRPPQEYFLLHEVADILYQSHIPGTQARQAFPDLDFAADPGSEFKAKLAGMSHKERIAWLVNDLAQKKIWKGADYLYEIQLAVDEGLDASNAAAAKLKEMDGQRTKYPANGFSGLLYILDGVGDKTQTPLVRHFVNDKDQSISNTAAGRGGVSQGHGNQYMAGY